MKVPGDVPLAALLFGESGGFVLEVAKAHAKNLQDVFAAAGVALRLLGNTTVEPRLCLNGVIAVAVKEAKTVWENGLRDKVS